MQAKKINSSATTLCCGLLLIFVLLYSQCISPLSGTVDDTDSGKVAVLYSSDGSRASYATVKVYNFHDTTLVLDTSTDKQGSYSLAGLNGTYSIWAEKDSMVAYQDSVVIIGSNKNIAKDTLKAPGAITGKIVMEQGDSPSSVVVHALGTHIYSNVNNSGFFTLKGLAEGSYILQLSSSLSGYTTTFSSLVSIQSGQADTLTSTLSLLYNGIPYVEGVTVSFDTLNGVVNLSWNKSTYANFQNFSIYRRPGEFVSSPFELLATTTDTFFSDQIGFFGEIVLNGSLQYKIVIRDKFEMEGRAYGYVTVNTSDPKSATTILSFAPGNIVETIVNEDVEIIVTARNPTRNLTKITWVRLSDNEILREINLGRNVLSISDTLRYRPLTPGEQGISVTVMDGGGMAWNDEFRVFSKYAYIPTDTLNSIFPLSIRTEKSIKSITIQFDTMKKITVPASNGVALCTLDTRTIYPSRIARLLIESSLSSKDTSFVYVKNSDPLIGCWVATKDTLVKECYHEDGKIESNREFAWLLGWDRQKERILIHQAAGNDIVFTPVFTDYNHCMINGLECTRAPEVSTLKKRLSSIIK